MRPIAAAAALGLTVAMGSLCLSPSKVPAWTGDRVPHALLMAFPVSLGIVCSVVLLLRAALEPSG